MRLNFQMAPLVALSPPCLSVWGKREEGLSFLYSAAWFCSKNVGFLALYFDVKLE